MSARPIIVKTEDGNTMRYPSLNNAVPYLNISSTTIRYCAQTGKKIQTKLGIVEIRFADELKHEE